MVSSFKSKSLAQVLVFDLMKNSSEEIQKLRANAEASLNKTAQLQQVMAQLEAAISRKENQKVKEKLEKR